MFFVELFKFSINIRTKINLESLQMHGMQPQLTLLPQMNQMNQMVGRPPQLMQQMLGQQMLRPTMQLPPGNFIKHNNHTWTIWEQEYLFRTLMKREHKRVWRQIYSLSQKLPNISNISRNLMILSFFHFHFPCLKKKYHTKKKT